MAGSVDPMRSLATPDAFRQQMREVERMGRREGDKLLTDQAGYQLFSQPEKPPPEFRLKSRPNVGQLHKLMAKNGIDWLRWKTVHLGASKEPKHALCAASPLSSANFGSSAPPFLQGTDSDHVAAGRVHSYNSIDGRELQQWNGNSLSSTR
ncbi:unnamed protein product [Hydatigera taeniaeformis]|uniref:Uncharacterized protein n=1 Tax=Hydatigena taeniaeformis TaxID=6205 RepID=A0A0R3XCN0_HYDTA|nr:unnamed protein product [Hydatigera taeniaeformis]